MRARAVLDPSNFVVDGALTFFTANDGTHGTEEWMTNGTAAGTIRLDSAPAASGASCIPIPLI